MAKVSKKSKRRILTFGTISVILIVYFFVTLVNYIISYSSLKIEEKNLNETLEQLQEKKSNLKIEIIKLNDPKYVARYAKENYLYSGDGEYVIKIDDKSVVSEDDKKIDYIKYYIYGGAILITLFVIIKKSSKRTS